MNDESLEALRSFDRPHALGAEGRARVEARMLATYAAETDASQDPRPTGDEPLDDVTVVDLHPEGVEAQKSGRRVRGWLTAAAAVAAAVAILALWPTDENPTPQRTASDDRAVAEDSEDSGCIVDLDPLAIALDRVRVNPTEDNTAALEAELERTVDRLREATGEFDTAEAILDTDTDLAERLQLLSQEIGSRAGAENCRLDRFAQPSSVGDYLPEPAGIGD
jgi:hypothetical protein